MLFDERCGNSAEIFAIFAVCTIYKAGFIIDFQMCGKKDGTSEGERS